MDYAKAFHLVARASKKATVPCVLIGGFAINFYKVTRNTLDIDFLITRTDFAKIEEALLAAGYAEEFATDAAIRFSNKKEALDIDFMIVDDMTREKIIKEGKPAEIVGEKLIIPSLNHLIALKLHAVKNNEALRPKGRSLHSSFGGILRSRKPRNASADTDATRAFILSP
jgi:hypothetical protein